MNIELTKTAYQDLKKLPKPNTLKVARKLAVLSLNPFLGKKLNGKLAGFYSLKAWPYRIIYAINQVEKSIKIASIEHRQGAYK